MSLNFQRLHETTNQAYAENFRILTQKMADPLLNPALHFLIGIPFKARWYVYNLDCNIQFANKFYDSKKHGHTIFQQIMFMKTNNF